MVVDTAPDCEAMGCDADDVFDFVRPVALSSADDTGYLLVVVSSATSDEVR
jgi:hypothetical protein